MTQIKDDKNTVKADGDHRNAIRQEAFRLAQMLEDSPEYRQFVSARDKLAEDDEQSSIMLELRHQQMVMAAAAMSGEDMDELANGAAGDIYNTLMNNNLVNDYLFAEGRLFRLISEVEQVFSERLELWNGQPIPGDSDISELN